MNIIYDLNETFDHLVTLRKADYTQSEFALKSGLAQGNISLNEMRPNHSWNVTQTYAKALGYKLGLVLIPETESGFTE